MTIEINERLTKWENNPKLILQLYGYQYIMFNCGKYYLKIMSIKKKLEPLASNTLYNFEHTFNELY